MGSITDMRDPVLGHAAGGKGMKKRDKLLIWWLCENDYKAIKVKDLKILPGYMTEEYKSRLGRPGRGRLWVSEKMKKIQAVIEVNPWPDSALGRLFGEGYGGIVFDGKSLPVLRRLPGIVTNLKLERVL
jgi:hypothetical protein